MWSHRKTRIQSPIQNNSIENKKIEVPSHERYKCKTIEDLVTWLFTKHHHNVTAIAHNSSKFDCWLIVRYLLNHNDGSLSNGSPIMRG